MFDTAIHKTENRDLEIATRNRYERKIDRLEHDLQQACTPEQLAQAQTVQEKFQQSLVFKYITAENSLVNAVVWKHNDLHHQLSISFELNGKQITISLPDVSMGIRLSGTPARVFDVIQHEICQALTQELTKDEMIIFQLIDQSLPWDDYVGGEGVLAKGD